MKSRRDRVGFAASRRLSAVAAAGAAIVFVWARGAGRVDAACNVIPGTSTAFRGTLGVLDRPFAEPGTFVELALDPACHAGSPGFSRDDPAAQVITVVFTPPAGPRNVVVLASDCGAVGLCPGAARTVCRPLDRPGEPAALQVIDARRLRFRFPDTDDVFLGPGPGADPDARATDDLTFTGPAAIAVTRAGDPLPCGLVTGTCADQSGLLACVDALFAADGTCGTAANERFGGFTALPPPNDYRALCTDPPAQPCTGVVDDVRFTVDAAGDALVPMDWRGILVPNALTIARRLRGFTSLEAFQGRRVPI